MSEDKEKKKIRDIISSGSEIAGGAVGGALGFLAGGPVGAAVLGAGGVAASKVITRVGSELSERLLGPRERTRIGATLSIAAEEINERIKKGEKVRDDGFFEENGTGRSSADELIEGVLLKSQREAEEKKIPYLAHLLANMTFDQEIGAPLGQQLIKAFDQLTYRQLCILRMCAIKDNLPLQKGDYRDGNITRATYQILHECFDLYTRNYINNGGSAALGITDISPASMTPQGLGVDIHNWTQLWRIPITDIKPIILALRERKEGEKKFRESEVTVTNTVSVSANKTTK